MGLPGRAIRRARPGHGFGSIPVRSRTRAGARSPTEQVKTEVFVVSAVRTAVGAFGGALRKYEPADLAARMTGEAIRRSGIDPATVGHVVFGQVIPTAPRDAYLARIAALGAGLPTLRSLR